MNLWTAAVAIVAIVMLASVINTGLKSRHRKRDDELESRYEKLAAELRARIETLEQIVTDEKSALKRQFDELER